MCLLMRKFLFLFLFFLFSELGFSYVVGSFFAKKYNEKTGKYHYIIMLGDIHEKRVEQNRLDLDTLSVLLSESFKRSFSVNHIIEVSPILADQSAINNMLSCCPALNLMQNYSLKLLNGKKLKIVAERRKRFCFDHDIFTPLKQSHLGIRSLYDILTALESKIFILHQSQQLSLFCSVGFSDQARNYQCSQNVCREILYIYFS